MPVWLGPSSWIVATGWGIARWDGTGYDIVRYSRTGMRADQDPPRLDVFAVLDDDGRAALIQRGGEEPSVWRIGEAGKGELVAASGPRLRTAIGSSRPPSAGSTSGRWPATRSSSGRRSRCRRRRR
jgi:hypothetical protein